LEEKDIKVLQFRKELINLLNKYNYTISGSYMDDGNIIINDEEYILKDSPNYELIKVDIDYNWISLDEEFILSCFDDKECNDYISWNNKIGIITDDIDKCNTIFNKIYLENEGNIEYFKNSTYSKELKLLSGEVYVWIKARKSSRGHKCSKAYIDKNIPLDILHNVVLPICVFVSRKDVKII